MSRNFSVICHGDLCHNIVDNFRGSHVELKAEKLSQLQDVNFV